MAAEDEKPLYTLHYFPFSLYSLMVRFGFVLGESLNSETAPNVEIRHVNLQKEENLSESYLTEISPKGQVRISPIHIVQYTVIEPVARISYTQAIEYRF